MEDQKKLLQFVTWLGENVPELKGQAPEQIISTINKLSESEEGQQMLRGLIEEFESSMTGMFKKGGKLAYLLCLKKGGNIQDCGCGKKIDKKQPGGRVLGSEQYPYATRRDALKAAMDEMGFSRAQARFAYKKQKNALRNAGFSGKEMLQNARYNIIDTAYPRAQASVPQLPVIDTNFEIEDTPIEINDTFTPIENQPLNVQKIDKFGGSFNSAFGAARRSELDKFYYNGPDKKAGWYITELRKAQSKSAPLGNAQPTVNKVTTGEGDPNATKRKDDLGVWYPGRPSR